MRVRPIGRYIKHLIARAPLAGWFNKKRSIEYLGQDNRGKETALIPWDGQLFYGPRSGVGSQVTKAIYERKVYEPEVTRAFVDLVEPGMVVVDVGAQFGYYTLMAAKRVRKDGKVLAFEPKNWVGHILAANIHINFYDNVEIFPYALFSKSDRIPIINYGSRVITDSEKLPNMTKKHDQFEEVQAMVFDEIVESIKIDKCDLVKVDVEGAELDTLKGMVRSIERWKPILLVEVHPNKLPHFGYTCNDLFQFIESLDYAFNPLNVDDSVVTKAINGEQVKGPINIMCEYSEEI